LKLMLKASDGPTKCSTISAALNRKFSSVLKSGGLKLLEVDMKAIGPYARAFGGPPVRQPKTRKKR